MPRRAGQPLQHAAGADGAVRAERGDRKAHPSVAGRARQGVRHGTGLPPPSPASPGSIAVLSPCLNLELLRPLLSILTQPRIKQIAKEITVFFSSVLRSCKEGRRKVVSDKWWVT
jgi:hypothetical protein